MINLEICVTPDILHQGIVMKPGVWAKGTEDWISPSSSRDLRIALHSRVVRIPPHSLINSFCKIRIFNAGGSYFGQRWSEKDM